MKIKKLKKNIEGVFKIEYRFMLCEESCFICEYRNSIFINTCTI